MKTTQTFQNKVGTFTTCKRGRGTEVHFAYTGSAGTFCSSGNARANIWGRGVGTTATCESCIKAAERLAL